MHGFTDELIGLDIAHRREIRQSQAQAQGLVNQLDQNVIMLTRALGEARAELSRERAARIAAETKLEMILDLEI